MAEGPCCLPLSLWHTKNTGLCCGRFLPTLPFGHLIPIAVIAHVRYFYCIAKSDADSPSEVRPTNGRAGIFTSAGLGCRKEALKDAATHRHEGDRGMVNKNGTQLRPKRMCELERVGCSGRMEEVAGASRVAADEFDETSVVRSRERGGMQEDTVDSGDEKAAVGDEGNRRSEIATGDGMIQPGGHRSNRGEDIEILAQEETTSGRVGNVGVCDAVKELEDEPDGGVSEYELQRLERIKRNQAFMDTLGLGAAMSPSCRSSRGGHSGVKKKKSARPAEDRTAREPVRRSTRTRQNKSMEEANKVSGRRLLRMCLSFDDQKGNTDVRSSSRKWNVREIVTRYFLGEH